MYLLEANLTVPEFNDSIRLLKPEHAHAGTIRSMSITYCKVL